MYRVWPLAAFPSSEAIFPFIQACAMGLKTSTLSPGLYASCACAGTARTRTAKAAAGQSVALRIASPPSVRAGVGEDARAVLIDQLVAATAQVDDLPPLVAVRDERLP